MANLIHILGSPIVHHNTTILAFFQNYHETYLAGHPPFRFMMAVDNMQTEIAQNLSEKYPNIVVELFVGKKGLAQGLIAHAKAHPQMRYFLHGQFNPKIWFAFLLNQLDAKRFSWHVWGADLYEEEKTFKYRLFYIARRLAQNKVGTTYATVGDASVLKARLPDVKVKRLYFPTKMNYALTPAPEVKALKLATLAQKQANEPFTILLGNSGDKTNHHLLGLEVIAKTFGDHVNVIVPMGYPEHNEVYIEQVRQKADALFSSGTVNILTERLAFDAYLACLSTCDLAYFLFERQQGIGTISLCIQLGVPFVLHPKNAFSADLDGAHIPYLSTSDIINQTRLIDVQTQLNAVEIKDVVFFAPNYLPDWHEILKPRLEDTDVNS